MLFRLKPIHAPVDHSPTSQVRVAKTVVAVLLGCIASRPADAQQSPGRTDSTASDESPVRYRPTLESVLQPGFWVLSAVGGVSGTSTAAFSRAEPRQMASAALNPVLDLSVQQLVSERLAIGLGVELGGYHVQREALPDGREIGDGLHGGSLHVGPRLTHWFPVTDQWFVVSELSAGVGPTFDWTAADRPSSTLGGVAAGGVGLGRLTGQFATAFGQVRRLERRLFTEDAGRNDRLGRWEVRVGAQIFATPRAERRSPRVPRW
jgi:hypothetical protein